MSFMVGGVSSADIESQIALALLVYGEISNHAIGFNIDDAVKTELTPDKPNTARSVSRAKLGKLASADLYIIAFAPQDGTGDESARRLDDLRSTRGYPRKTAVVPRNKAAELEVHLTVTAFNGRTPRPFAGCLDLIGLDSEGTGLARLGSLGQTPEDFLRIIRGQEIGDPTATFTLWRAGDVVFGDPHAAYNNTPILQVCGFIGIPTGTDQGVLRELNPQLPHEVRRIN